MDQIPNEILVSFFEFLSEADKRKLSVTCSLFNQIYRQFCTLLPYQVHLEKYDFSNFRILGWSSWLDFQFFEANIKFFDIFGPKPLIFVKVNDDAVNYPVLFECQLRDMWGKNELPTYPDLSDFKTVKVKIVKTHNCRLKFTDYHSGILHVDGCSLSEIHVTQWTQ